MAQAYTAGTGATVLMIAGNDVNFHNRVIQSLDKINQTAAGQALFAAIAQNRVNNRNVGIQQPQGQGGSQCACVSPMSDVTRTLLAQAVFDGGNFRNELNACLALAGRAGDGQWLANRINATPVYDIRGAPSVAPSNLGVSQQEADDWINGVTVFPAPYNGAAVSRLERALLTALWPQARQRPGPGGHSAVRWRSESRTIRLTTGVVQTRSKSIGLAHELVHAYYNGAGLQMGRDNPEPDDNGVPTVPSAALFEYQCVGLGIWAGEPISENAIRAQWTQVVSYTLFGGRTSVHYRAVPARAAY
jgi:hypothetical protein